MKYTIAVCDDDATQIEIILEYINIAAKTSKYEFDFIVAQSGQELLDKVKRKEVNVFLLDIEMGGINGLDTGEKLRAIFDNAIIVYITGFKDYALNAFGVKAFDYIIKPLTKEKFNKLFSDICKRIDELNYYIESEKIFSVINKENIYKIPYSDIYYFEKSLRKIKVVFKGGKVEFYGSFQKLKESLDMLYFTQCHQSFIVNNETIYSYKNHYIVIKELNTDIPVSKSYVKEVREVLARKLF